MGRQSSVLDGPAMGYGPGRQQPRGGISVSTLVLGVLCVVLAALLALSLVGRHQAAERATGVPSPSASRTDIPPAGAPDAVAAFLGAWSLAPAERDNVLASVTVTGVADTVSAETAATLASAQPAGATAYGRINDQTLTADVPLPDGSTLRLRLVFDQAAVYGWLISSVRAS